MKEGRINLAEFAASLGLTTKQVLLLLVTTKAKLPEPQARLSQGAPGHREYYAAADLRACWEASQLKETT